MPDDRLQQINAEIARLDRRAAEHDQAIAEAKDTFTRIDLRFDKVDARFDAADARMDRMDARFDTLDAKVDSLDAKVDSLDAKIDSRCDALNSKFLALHESLESKFNLIVEGYSTLEGRMSRLSAGWAEWTVETKKVREKNEAWARALLANHEGRIAALEGGAPPATTPGTKRAAPRRRQN
jgi:chromosome segregation ATPase